MDTRKQSNKQEKRIAKDIGGKVQPASGARWGHRRDVKSDNYLIEAKTTSQDSYSLKDADLAFLKKQAYQAGKIPAYIIELSKYGEEIVFVPEQDVVEEVVENWYGATEDRSKNKTFSINSSNRGFAGLIRLVLPSGVYIGMSYEAFLEQQLRDNVYTNKVL